MDESTFARGAVVTGFSFPIVALYAAAAGVVTYSNGMDLARGVNIVPSIEVANEDNTLYADNQAAEEGQRRFRSGTVAITVDGLLTAAERMIMGLPQAAKKEVTVGSGTVNFNTYGKNQKIPYVGYGNVVRYQSNGEEFFRAFVYRKMIFSQFDVPAATEAQETDWQTQELSAKLMRDDTPERDWKWFSDPLATELEAYNAARVVLGMTVAQTLPAV